MPLHRAKVGVQHLDCDIADVLEVVHGIERRHPDLCYFTLDLVAVSEGRSQTLRGHHCASGVLWFSGPARARQPPRVRRFH